MTMVSQENGSFDIDEPFVVLPAGCELSIGRVNIQFL